MDPALQVHVDTFRLPVAEAGGSADGPDRHAFRIDIVGPDPDGIISLAKFPAFLLTGTALHGIEETSLDGEALEGSEIIGDPKAFDHLFGFDLTTLVESVVLELDPAAPHDSHTEKVTVRTDGRAKVTAIGTLAGNPDLIADGPVFFQSFTRLEGEAG